jgi:hypothetical protein
LELVLLWPVGLVLPCPVGFVVDWVDLAVEAIALQSEHSQCDAMLWRAEAGVDQPDAACRFNFFFFGRFLDL